MSNSLAIATVTTALAQIVRRAAQEAVGGADVVFGRPDNNGTGNSLRKVQLYLYQVTPNPALRNIDLPTRGSDGGLVRRALVSLDLHYLLSFYGNETELEPQRMMGAVVRDLHSQPLLSRQAIEDAVAGNPFLAGSNLADALERVRFTPAALNLEELSRLWSIFFQTPHALSVAYQGNVVVIESDESPQPALPVLKRGANDSGVDSTTGPYPSIDGIHIAVPGDAGPGSGLPSCPNARLGAYLTVRGANLTGADVKVRFIHPLLQEARDITVLPDARTDREIKVTLPADADEKSKWAAGMYTISVIIRRSEGGREMTTNFLSLPMSPYICGILPPNPVVRDSNGDVTFTVTCTPMVLPGQKVLLLLGDRETEALDHPAPTDTLSFVVRKALPVTDTCTYLRVDGVNSMPIIVTGTPPCFGFDPAQKVTII